MKARIGDSRVRLWGPMGAAYGCAVAIASIAGCDNQTKYVRNEHGTVQQGNSWVAQGGVSRVEVVGDWDDVDAAMETAIFRSECAIVRRDEVSEKEVYFEVLSVADEPGWVRVRRLDGPSESEATPGSRDVPPVRIGMEVSIGRFSNAGREKRLIDGFAARLRRLSGVDYAPAAD